MKLALQLSFALVALFMSAATAWPQDPPEPFSAAAAEDLVAQLNTALEERDAVILELVARVQALEEMLYRSEAVAPSDTVQRAELADATLSANEELDEADRLAQSALERTLIETGGLLLPAGTLEIEPSLAYSLSATDTIDIDCLLIADILCIGDINSKQFRRESYGSDWTFRLGLPWNMQLDARVPFGYDTSRAVFGDGTSDRSKSTDLGDMEFALSRQLVWQEGWRPDLLGELRWKDRSGSDPFDQDEDSLATGTGFNDLRLGFTAVKVRDPLVLFGNLSYTYTFPDEKPEIGKVRPGDGIGAQLGMAVALNLETSLNFGWTQSWIDSTRLDGEKIVGSSRRPGSLRIGATYVPAAGRSIDFGVAFGLTDDAPDVEVRLSFPLRLGYRVPFPSNNAP